MLRSDHISTQTRGSLGYRMVYAAFYIPYSIRSGSTSHPLRSAKPDTEFWPATVLADFSGVDIYCTSELRCELGWGDRSFFGDLWLSLLSYGPRFSRRLKSILYTMMAAGESLSKTKVAAIHHDNPRLVCTTTTSAVLLILIRRRSERSLGKRTKHKSTRFGVIVPHLPFAFHVIV